LSLVDVGGWHDFPECANWITPAADFVAVSSTEIDVATSG
jgi:hypothetical protein